eukprot:s3720_g5.t1
MERELAESKALEADRAQELKEKETELITVCREKVKELADAKKREQELTMLLEEAQQQILELTSALGEGIPIKQKFTPQVSSRLPSPRLNRKDQLGSGISNPDLAHGQADT